MKKKRSQSKGGRGNHRIKYAFDTIHKYIRLKSDIYDCKDININPRRYQTGRIRQPK